MNYTFPKNAAIVVIMFLSLSFQNAYSQSKKPSQDVTPTMARKIGNYCQKNQSALSLFVKANPEQVQNRNDNAIRLLRELDKHLDCAENFIITLLCYNYGDEMSYFALKDAGFTIKETDMAESIRAKEEKKQRGIDEKRGKEEQALLKRIEKSEDCTKDVLSVQPDIKIDMPNEEIVNLNDYFNSKTGWGDYTDWNHTGFEDDESAKAFDEALKKNGIYWSKTKETWVKRIEYKQSVVKTAFGGGKTDNGSQSSGQGNTYGSGNQGSHDGTPGAKQYGLGGGVGTSKGFAYSLSDRNARSLPKPKYTGNEEGIVVVQVTVDKNGAVTKAEPDVKDSNTANPELIAAACKAALKARFNADPNSPAFQKGIITYHFKLQ